VRRWGRSSPSKKARNASPTSIPAKSSPATRKPDNTVTAHVDYVIVRRQRSLVYSKIIEYAGIDIAKPDGLSVKAR
jgi:hypothetical protein